MKRLILATMLFTATGAWAAGATTYYCKYPTFSDPTGIHRDTENFSLTFVVDSGTQKAYVIGNNGSEQVHLVNGWTAITFVEITDSGNVMTTTLAKGKSVHSRNSVADGQIIPTQYYGTCTVR